MHTQGPCCSSFDVSAYHDAAASGHMRYIGQTLPSVNHHACWSMIRVREEDGRRRPWKDRVTLSTGRTVGGYNPDEPISTGILATNSEYPSLYSMVPGSRNSNKGKLSKDPRRFSNCEAPG